jgi:hypothetical protein
MQSTLSSLFPRTTTKPSSTKTGCDNERLLRCGREFAVGLGMNDIPDDATELLVQLNAILLREGGPDGVLDICRYVAKWDLNIKLFPNLINFGIGF